MPAPPPFLHAGSAASLYAGSAASLYAGSAASLYAGAAASLYVGAAASSLWRLRRLPAARLLTVSGPLGSNRATIGGGENPLKTGA